MPARLADAWVVWEKITAACDPWLDTVTTAKLQERVVIDGKPSPNVFGSLLHRTIYHYWYHTGENMGVHQALGHTALPDFVGDTDAEAPYRSE